MPDLCDTCVHYPPSSFGGKPCSMCNPNDPVLDCYQRREEQPQTNGDRIRAMSDEELAAFCCDWFYCPDCPGHGVRSPDCANVLLAWLQSHADGGDGNAV